MEALAEATLSLTERRALGRAVEELKRELGDELLAVWLYGSRARGEIPEPESDIDLMVITRSGTSDHHRVSRLVRDAAEIEGAKPFFFSVQVADPQWVSDSRAIESFFMQDLDRDKLVLAGLEGGELPGVAPFDGYARPAKGPAGMSPRSWQHLEKAWERLRFAERGFEAGDDRGSVASLAYYAMLYAASAALSEEGLYARTHSGTWHRFRETFVATGRFEAELAGQAQDAQELREHADYGALTPGAEETARVLSAAREFVADVSRMLGLEPP